jgi:hypothetical protein
MTQDAPIASAFATSPEWALLVRGDVVFDEKMPNEAGIRIEIKGWHCCGSLQNC